MYGQKIIKKYRKEAPTESKYENVPCFKEFIDYLLDQKVSSMNNHWVPIYNLCSPCNVDYKVIGR